MSLSLLELKLYLGEKNYSLQDEKLDNTILNDNSILSVKE